MDESNITYRMITTSFIHHSFSSILSIIVNAIIMTLSVGSSVRGEFKWVFLSTSITNLFYSIFHILFLPLVVKHSSNPDFSLILTMNPIPTIISSPDVCANVFYFFFYRQSMSNVISICVIPLNRVAWVCYNRLKRKVLWGGIAISVNFIPLLAYIPIQFFNRTTISDISLLMTPQHQIEFIDKFGSSSLSKICYFTHNWRETGDIIQTLTDLFFILSSYIITIICIIQLVYYVRTRRDMRLGPNMERQKAILITIIVQTIVPLLSYIPYLFFTSSRILHQTIDDEYVSDKDTVWYDLDYQYLILSWSPFIGGTSTLILLKPYRRALLSKIPCVHIVSPTNRQLQSNINALNSSHPVHTVRTYEIRDNIMNEDDYRFHSESIPTEQELESIHSPNIYCIR